jgi:hypothetical protein
VERRLKDLERRDFKRNESGRDYERHEKFKGERKRRSRSRDRKEKYNDYSEYNAKHSGDNKFNEDKYRHSKRRKNDYDD